MAVKFSRDSLKGTTKTQGDFNLSHKFNMEIDGVTMGGIHKVDGIEFEVEVVEYQDGEDITTHYRPGRFKPGRLILERDWSSTQEFLKWRKTVMDGKVERKSISLIFKNDAEEESKRVNFFDCYPAKWVAPTLSARSSGHASEKLEVVFERLELK
jgi:phage tail-like protein